MFAALKISEQSRVNSIAAQWDVVARLGLNERQALAIAHVKQHGRISNPDCQTLAKTTKKTATRDLSDLNTRGLFEQRGERGPGVHYVLAQKRDIMGTLGPLGGNSIGSELAQSGHELPLKATQKRDKNGTNGTSSRRRTLHKPDKPALCIPFSTTLSPEDFLKTVCNAP